MSTVGFTGTAEGMTHRQDHKLLLVLNYFRKQGYRVFRHGDCVGSDDHAATMASFLGYKVWGHPPTNEGKRAFNKATKFWEESADYLIRDGIIVDKSNLLVATPHGFSEVRRSGTWYTIRYARRVKLPLRIIIWPDGTTKKESE